MNLLSDILLWITSWIFQIPKDAVMLYKGTESLIDHYSCFWDNKKQVLEQILVSHNRDLYFLRTQLNCSHCWSNMTWQMFISVAWHLMCVLVSQAMVVHIFPFYMLLSYPSMLVSNNNGCRFILEILARATALKLVGSQSVHISHFETLWQQFGSLSLIDYGVFRQQKYLHDGIARIVMGAPLQL